ncbi:MAG: mechanosensitive ion channel domain-containing protein [Elainellaceae cyanobacterium]
MMMILDIVQDVFQVDAEFQQNLIAFGIQLGGFIALLVGAFIFTRFVPTLLRFGVDRLAPKPFATAYGQITDPIRQALVRALFLGLLVLSLELLREYDGLYGVANFFAYLTFSVCTGWFLSRLVHRILRIHGTRILQRLSYDVDDFIMVLENLLNAAIVFFTVVYFAQTQNLNLISVLAGLGIVGLALSFAAKETFAQIIGSIVLYLDRPYVPGEYVRVSFNPKDEDVYGRVEAVGLRSTKIRVAAKNTLVIAPNSVMVKKDIENISRGTKVMSLLYLDFAKVLNDTERALVKDVVSDAIGGLLGVEPLSVKIFLFEPDEKPGTRARVSFFLLSSSQGALRIRKRLVEVTNEKITACFAKHNLKFTMQDPMLYVDSPVTR